jgi:hypothetical protein
MKSIGMLCKDAAARFGWPLIDAANRLVVAVAAAVLERWTTTFTGGPAAGPILVHAGACTLLGAIARCTAGGATGFMMLFDSAAAPVLGAAPVVSLELVAGETGSTPMVPVSIANALYWACSSTGGTYTPAGAPNLNDLTCYWSLAP